MERRPTSRTSVDYWMDRWSDGNPHSHITRGKGAQLPWDSLNFSAYHSLTHTHIHTPPHTHPSWSDDRSVRTVIITGLSVFLFVWSPSQFGMFPKLSSLVSWCVFNVPRCSYGPNLLWIWWYLSTFSNKLCISMCFVVDAGQVVCRCTGCRVD